MSVKFLDSGPNEYGFDVEPASPSQFKFKCIITAATVSSNQRNVIDFVQSNLNLFN